MVFLSTHKIQLHTDSMLQEMKLLLCDFTRQAERSVLPMPFAQPGTPGMTASKAPSVFRCGWSM